MFFIIWNSPVIKCYRYDDDCSLDFWAAAVGGCKIRFHDGSLQFTLTLCVQDLYGKIKINIFLQIPGFIAPQVKQDQNYVK